MDHKRLSWRDKFRAVQSQPDLMRKYQNSLSSNNLTTSPTHNDDYGNLASKSRDSNSQRVKPNRQNRPQTAQEAFQYRSRPNTAKLANSRPSTARITRSHTLDQISVWEMQRGVNKTNLHIGRPTSGRSVISHYSPPLIKPQDSDQIQWSAIG